MQFHVKNLYYQPEALNFKRGREIYDKYSDVPRIPIDSHWEFDKTLGPDAVKHNLEIKRSTLVLGVKSGLSCWCDGRSANFVAPSSAFGCPASCGYCFAYRRKSYANPVTIFANIDKIIAYLIRHAARQGQKPVDSDTVDPTKWCYEIGTNSDCSFDARISNNVLDLLTAFRSIPNAKCTFATKHVNYDLCNYNADPNHNRIRFSLMPHRVSKVVDVGTSPIADRIKSINSFVEAGYEVHLNFSPVIVYDGWQLDYVDLFDNLNCVLSEKAKAQLKAEVIFLTHNPKVHDINMQWHPKCEDFLWHPEMQAVKYSLHSGQRNLRYKIPLKRGFCEEFKNLMGKHLPCCKIRYIF